MAKEPTVRYESVNLDRPSRPNESSNQSFGRINYGDRGDSDRYSLRSHRDH